MLQSQNHAGVQHHKVRVVGGQGAVRFAWTESLMTHNETERQKKEVCGGTLGEENPITAFAKSPSGFPTVALPRES